MKTQQLAIPEFFDDEDEADADEEAELLLASDLLGSVCDSELLLGLLLSEFSVAAESVERLLFDFAFAFARLPLPFFGFELACCFSGSSAALLLSV